MPLERLTLSDRPLGWLLTLAVLVVLTLAVAYEAAVALGWLAVGPLPGQAPVGNGLVFGAALLALLVGTVVFAGYASLPGAPPADALWSLVGPAAAAFVVARLYSFDPYYAPTLRRFSDDGLIAKSWVYALVFLALVAAILARSHPRIGASLTALALLLSAFTAFVMGLGR